MDRCLYVYASVLSSLRIPKNVYIHICTYLDTQIHACRTERHSTSTGELGQRKVAKSRPASWRCRAQGSKYQFGVSIITIITIILYCYYRCYYLWFHKSFQSVAIGASNLDVEYLEPQMRNWRL